MIYFFFHKTLDVGGPGVCIVEKLIAHHLPKKKRPHVSSTSLR